MNHKSYIYGGANEMVPSLSYHSHCIVCPATYKNQSISADEMGTAFSTEYPESVPDSDLCIPVGVVPPRPVVHQACQSKP